MELNKYQLIDGLINDLGDDTNGVQVRGYRNLNIIRSSIEALAALRQGLKQDEDATRDAIAAKDEELAILRAKIARMSALHNIEIPSSEDIVAEMAADNGVEEP